MRKMCIYIDMYMCITVYLSSEGLTKADGPAKAHPENPGTHVAVAKHMYICLDIYIYICTYVYIIYVHMSLYRISLNKLPIQLEGQASGNES